MKNLQFLSGMKLALWWLIVLLGLAMQAMAQEKPASGVWSLEQCVKYAIKNNLAIQQNELNAESALNNLQQTKVARYPSVNANASQAFNWGYSVDPFTNLFVNQRINSNNFSLSTSMNLFNGFQNRNTIKQNQANYEVNKLNTQQQRNTISLNVATFYLNVLLNKELLLVAQKNVASTQEQLSRTEKLFAAGAIAENDVINQRATLANNESAVVNAQNQVDIAKANLQQLMNLPIENTFDAQDVPVEALRVEALTENSKQIYEIAEKSQYNVKSADMTVKSREHSIEVARAGRYPSLTLNGGLFSGYSSATILSTGDIKPFGNQVKDNFRQQVSLNLSIPIFNGWQVKNNINNAVINKRSAEVTAQSTRNQLRIDIENAYITAKSAYNTYEARVKQLDAQELAFTTQEKRYNAGAANVVDLNLARITRDNARSDLIRAKYDYLFRKKVMDFYQDKPLSFE